MIKAILLAVFMALPVAEYSEDGQYMRLYNGTEQAFYCWVDLTDGRRLGGILYAGRASPWRHRSQVIDWECE